MGINIKNKEGNIIWTFEMMRHLPGSRIVLVSAALYRLLPRKSKKLRFLPKIKLINMKIEASGMNRYMPQQFF